ncbi:MAG: hypothetical protein IPI46_13160 [Bacteroidetes bacterium]|nr:hypothetical protein [Bacteroidota bacterium]
MKTFLILLILFPTILQAQSKLSDLQGKWQEEKRLNKREKEIEFTDTIRIEFQTSGFAMIRRSGGGTFTGEAELKQENLSIDHQKFEIEELTKNALVLSDKQGLHHLKRMDEFTMSPVKRVLPGVEEGKRDFSFKSVQGKWTCYKKTDPDFKGTTFYIKSIDIKEEKPRGTFLGTASFNNSDSVYTTDAKIIFDGNVCSITSAEQVVKAKVLKSDGEEMILESGTVNYFLKRLGAK